MVCSVSGVLVSVRGLFCVCVHACQCVSVYVVRGV